MSGPLLWVEDLCVHFPVRRGWLGRSVGTIRAVEELDLSIERGRTLGLVGESGCGKSTAACRAILRLIPIARGRIELDGQDLGMLRGKRLRAARRHMQMIFQDPYASLDPRMTVFDIVAEPLRAHGLGRTRAEASGSGWRSCVSAWGSIDASATLSARVLGWTATAHRHRPRPGAGAEAGGGRRAGERARREHSRADRQPARQASGGAGYQLPVHRARNSSGSFDTCRTRWPSCTSVGSGARADRAAVRAARASLHPGLARRDSSGRSRNRAASSVAGAHGRAADSASPPPGCAFHPRCPHAFERCRSERPELTPRGDGQLGACHLAEPPPFALGPEGRS